MSKRMSYCDVIHSIHSDTLFVTLRWPPHEKGKPRLRIKCVRGMTMGVDPTTNELYAIRVKDVRFNLDLKELLNTIWSYTPLDDEQMSQVAQDIVDVLSSDDGNVPYEQEGLH